MQLRFGVEVVVVRLAERCDLSLPATAILRTHGDGRILGQA